MPDHSADFDNCPHCGVRLAAHLVALIRDPKEPESCPKRKAQVAS